MAAAVNFVAYEKMTQKIFQKIRKKVDRHKKVFYILQNAKYSSLKPMQTKVENNTLQIPAKLYRIGELVSYTPFSRQTIHNYTIMGLIREAKWTDGGHRLYDESVFERLSKIVQLKRTKTLSEIRQILCREDGINSS